MRCFNRASASKKARGIVFLMGMLAVPSLLCAQEAAPAAGASPASQEDLKKVIQDQGIYIESAKPGITLSGYVDAGYTYGFQGDNTVIPDRKTVDAKPGSNFGLNAFKLAIEKPLPSTNDYAAGFRADLIFGQDASIIDGNGNTGTADGGGANSSDLFVEQAFAQFNLPVGNGIKFQVGKFASPLGYEVIERPSNMNITYGNLFTDITPTDHTGVLASYKVNDLVDVKAGVVDGINTSSGTSFGSSTDGVGLLATVNLTAPGGNANVQNGIYFGFNPGSNSSATAANLADPNNGAPFTASRTALWVYDTYGQWKPKFAKDKLTLAIEGDLGAFGTNTATGTTNSTTWSGAGLYAKYQLTKILSIASRTDWIHNDDGQKFGGLNPSDPSGSQDIYSQTITAEIDAWENMLLRAEYRLDWGQTVGDLSPTSSTPTFASTTATTTGPAQMVDLEVVYSF